MSILVIAECGINHGGDIQEAMRLVVAAKRSGADVCKFQHFNSRRLWGDSRIEHLELTDAQMLDIKSQCDDLGIEFAGTPFGVEEVQFLAPLVKRMKVASGCITRTAILETIPLEMPVILSTGMSTPNDINGALNALQVIDRESDVTLLHCTSAYPCAIEDVNLYAMNTLLGYYGLPVGYSDHTLGITIPIAAAAMGATVIEKHLTLDRSAIGPDHKASIEPAEFRVMVSAIRTVEAALGDGVKRVMPCETELRKAWRG